MRRWPPIVRKAAKLLLLLAGGAVINVAVAWGFFVNRGALEGPLKHASQQEAFTIWCRFREDRSPIEDDSWAVEAFGRDDVWNVNARECTGVRSISVWRKHAIREMCEEIQAGWPSMSLCGQFGDSSMRGFVDISQCRLADYSSMTTRWRWLPIYPLWPGFAINTLLYAGILWLIFAAPFALRRRLRRMYGHCPACGYDLRGSESGICPECGAPARSAPTLPSAGRSHDRP